MENTRNLIMPHAVEIIAAINYGWENFFKTPLCEKYDKSTRASMVYNLSVEKLKNYPAFYPIKKNRTTYFSLEGQVVFRIKLGNANGYSKNYPTKATLDFHNPQTQFSDLPNIQKCEVVYILNATETEIADIRIVFRKNKKIINYFSILENNSTAQHDIEFLNTELNTNNVGIAKLKKGIIPDDQKKETRDKDE